MKLLLLTGSASGLVISYQDPKPSGLRCETAAPQESNSQATHPMHPYPDLRQFAGRLGTQALKALLNLLRGGGSVSEYVLVFKIQRVASG